MAATDRPWFTRARDVLIRSCRTTNRAMPSAVTSTKAIVNKLNFVARLRRIFVAIQQGILISKYLTSTMHKRLGYLNFHVTRRLLVQGIDDFAWHHWRECVYRSSPQNLERHLTALHSQIRIVPIKGIHSPGFHPGSREPHKRDAILKGKQQDVLGGLGGQHQLINHAP